MGLSATILSPVYFSTVSKAPWAFPTARAPVSMRAPTPVLLGKGALLDAYIRQTLKNLANSLELLVAVYFLPHRHDFFFHKAAEHVLGHAIFFLEKNIQVLMLRHIQLSSLF